MSAAMATSTLRTVLIMDTFKSMQFISHLGSLVQGGDSHEGNNGNQHLTNSLNGEYCQLCAAFKSPWQPCAGE